MKIFGTLLGWVLVGVAVMAQWTVAIGLEGQPPAFRVIGSGILSRLNNPNLPNFLKVFAGAEQTQAVAGEYLMEKGALVFRPRFPLEPGVAYKAVYKLGGEEATETFTIPKPVVVPTTTVETVYPTGEVLPENQLKLYVHFSAPMSKGEARQRIHLFEEGAGEVKLPFLELDEELWDRDFRRLTVLFDPGRVKRGLVPNREVGSPLKAGKSYRLTVDAEWKDAKGVPLKAAFEKKFRAETADRTPLDPKKWAIAAPRKDTQGTLAVDFGEPLDAALLLTFLDVISPAGKVVKGTIALDEAERKWHFTPKEPWVAGKHTIEILGTLEDLAGNKIGRAFDVDVFDQVQQRVESETHAVEFTVE